MNSPKARSSVDMRSERSLAALREDSVLERVSSDYAGAIKLSGDGFQIFELVERVERRIGLGQFGEDTVFQQEREQREAGAARDTEHDETNLPGPHRMNALKKTKNAQPNKTRSPRIKGHLDNFGGDELNIW